MFLSVVFTLFIMSCGAKLHTATLTVGVLDEPYSFYLAAEDESWDWFDQSYMVFSVTEGFLPYGIALSSNGMITGTPVEVGNFEFRATAFAIDDGWGYYYDDDDVTSDSEWYTLFVTEKSTNDDCPSPNSTAVTESYICLGAPRVQNLAAGESFILDANYFVEYSKANSYDIWQMDFTIEYDPTLFTINSNDLGSVSLREAATRSGATVDFITSTEGSVRVIISGVNKSFHKSGRILDLPFEALTDIPAGEHDFNLTVNSISSDNSDDNLPDTFAVQGFLTVSEDIVIEETIEEEDAPTEDASITEDFVEPTDETGVE